MKSILKIFFSLLLMFMAQNVNAQTAGDRLFAQGQKLQMTQTVSAQNQAIAKFVSAKKAYDSSAKKSLCDNQIAICKNNIKTITQKTKVVSKKKLVVTQQPQANTVDKTPEVYKEPVKLSLSLSYMEFKAAGKVSDNYEVVVSCNYDDWSYKCPEWIHVSQNGNRLVVTAEPNKESEERSGLLTVTCQDEKAELRISQKSKFSIKSIFGGKKGK